MLTSIDQVALASYCQLVGRLAWAANQTRVRKRRIVETPNGHKQIHPALVYERQLIEQIKSLASEFGLTPASRERVRDLTPLGGQGSGGSPNSVPENDGKTPITDRLGRPC